jgi:hypothetical protein
MDALPLAEVHHLPFHPRRVPLNKGLGSQVLLQAI